VKIYFFGHSHQYSHKVLDGLHLVNLPATAYMFTKGEPTGWMDLHLEERGAKTRLHCLDPKHPLHNDQLDLRWRA
jgi:Icc protein